MDPTVASQPFAPTPNEESLVERLQAGDEIAFEECVRIYGGRILQVARRILGNEEDAQDAVQDAFLAAFQQIGRFEERSSLGTWLHRIAVNAALMRLRKRQSRPVASIEDWLPRFGHDEHHLDPPAPWKETSQDLLLKKETRELVTRSIDQLPEIYRTVLLLRDIEELDTEETARLLGTSAGVVKTRLHRARQALRAILDPHFRRDNVE
jgi:RNA polymerase sigma-70 factor (ECF subfamily)